MEELKSNNLNIKQETASTPEEKIFAVEKYPSYDRSPKGDNGFIYEIHFATEEDAAKAVKEYWNAMEENTPERVRMTSKGIKSGMLRPTIDDITSQGRTAPRKALSRDLEKHPNKLFVVSFNGNTKALSEKGEATLRQLGFIE